MPRYNFRCTACGNPQEERRPMAQASEPGICEACDGETRRSWDDPTGFLFRPANYRDRPGDKGYDRYFQVRDGKQWVDTPKTAYMRQKDS